MTPSLGQTAAGVTVWRLTCLPGQETGLQHLTWGGPGAQVHLCAGGVRDEEGQEFTGQVQSAISMPCADLTEAQREVDAYMTQIGVTH